MCVTIYSETELNEESVWEQRLYANPLVGRPASQGRERQPSVAARSVWGALYVFFNNCIDNPWRYSSEEPRPTEVVAAK